MIRNACLIITLLFISHRASAVGVGEITVDSALNQPLKARITLSLENTAEIDEIEATLAGKKVFQRAGIERHPSLTDLRFNPVVAADGAAHIQVTSRLPLREAYLEFFLTVSWGDGELIRGYIILFDPPASQESEKPQPGIGDSRQVVASSLETDQELEQLKGELEQKVSNLQSTLKEKERKIDAISERLNLSKRDEIPSGKTVPQEVLDKHDKPATAIHSEPTDRESVEKLPMRELTTVTSQTGTNASLGYTMLNIILVVLLPLLVILLILRARRSALDRDETGKYQTLSRIHDDPGEASSQAEMLFRDELVNQGARLSDSDKVEKHLAEADIYLAYRRFDQAETLIRDGISQNRDSIELKAKLLEIYAVKRDKERFMAYLEESADAIMAASPDIWGDVVALGRKLIPDHPLIKGKTHETKAEKAAG